MIHSRIAGTGSHLPEKVVTNFDLEKMMDDTYLDDLRELYRFDEAIDYKAGDVRAAVKAACPGVSMKVILLPEGAVT